MILTLKDAPVLEEGGDVLENVNILDKEKVWLQDGCYISSLAPFTPHH